MARRAAAREAGVTLVELMVAVALAGIVLSAAASAFIQSQRTVADTLRRQSDLGQARTAVDAVSADLRTLVPLGGTYLRTAEAQEISFFALRDVPPGEAPVRITLELEPDGDLVSSRTRAPTGSGPAPDPSVYDDPTAPRRSLVLARGVRTGNTMFRYYASYRLVPVGPAPSASPSAQQLNPVTSGSGPPQVSAADRARVRFVEVIVEVESAGARDLGRTRVEQVVRLPNM